MGRSPCISPGLFHAWPGCLWELLRLCASTGAACTKPQVFLRHLQITWWRERIHSSDFYTLQLFLSVRVGVKPPVWDCLNKLAQISSWASLLCGLWLQDAGSGRKWCDSAGQGTQKTRSPWLSALVLTWLTVTASPHSAAQSQCSDKRDELEIIWWKKMQAHLPFFTSQDVQKALEIPALSRSKLCGNTWAVLSFLL